MDEIEFVSTSRYSATGSDIVIRATDQVRLVFRPELIENPSDPHAAVKGKFLYQRKGKHDGWTDAPFQSLSTLKKGEGYQLEIKSGELLPLLRELSSLYRLHHSQGVPQGRRRYVRLEENLARLLELGETDLHGFLDAHPEDAVKTLARVLRWLSSSAALSDFISNDGGQIALMNALVGAAALGAVRRIWEQSASNRSEEFWQGVLGNHAFVLSQLFAFPIVLIREKAFVGGKKLDNRHGSVVDFLAKAESSANALLIEIKTPMTPLLGSQYRDEVYPLSPDLTGSLAQILKCRDTLVTDLRSLQTQGDEQLLATEPRCLVLLGNSSELDTPQKRMSFERFRERLSGVTIVTFDELFLRVRKLEELMSPTSK